MRTVGAWMIVLTVLFGSAESQEQEPQRVEIDWTAESGTSKVQNYNKWRAPPGWKKGQPEFYFPFENSDSLTLTNPDQIVDGLFGKSVKTSKDPPEIGIIEGLSSACIMQPGSCSKGLSISAWVSIYDGLEKQSIITSTNHSSFQQGFQAACSDHVLSWMPPYCWYRLITDEISISIDRADRSADDATWFQFTFVFNNQDDNKHATLYYNGTQVASEIQYTTFDKNPKGTGTLAVGLMYLDQKDRNLGAVMMDELTLWNIPLTAQEVKGIFDNDVRRMEQ